jgi:hypothetical protein
VPNQDLLIRLEYYNDPNPKKPKAWQAFEEIWAERDPVEEGYQTVVIDSMTSLNLIKFWHSQYKKMPYAKDPRKWYGDTTEALEQMTMGRFAAFRCNVVLVAHISREKDERSGSMVYWPSAPGRLGPKGGGLPSAFSETYRAYVDKDGDHLLQTETSQRYTACTQIMAPDNCEPKYSALWENWKGDTRPPIHVLVYGLAGAKKSILAATFPKPMLVVMCDAMGKEMPYLRAGDAQGVKFNKSLEIYTQNVLRRAK